MSLNEILTAALNPVAPVEADAYEGRRATYLTFNYDTIPANYGDDEPGAGAGTSVRARREGYPEAAPRRKVRAGSCRANLAELYQRFRQGRAALCL